MPINVTEDQLHAITVAANALDPSDRDRFFAAVALELLGKPIGDGSVGVAIRTAQLKFAHPEPTVQPSRWAGPTPRFEKRSKAAA
jgi:hypothetical protein